LPKKTVVGRESSIDPKEPLKIKREERYRPEIQAKNLPRREISSGLDADHNRIRQPEAF